METIMAMAYREIAFFLGRVDLSGRSLRMGSDGLRGRRSRRRSM